VWIWAALSPDRIRPEVLLVAQACVEQLTIVTADPFIARYDVAILAP